MKVIWLGALVFPTTGRSASHSAHSRPTVDRLASQPPSYTHGRRGVREITSAVATICCAAVSSFPPREEAKTNRSLEPARRRAGDAAVFNRMPPGLGLVPPRHVQELDRQGEEK